MKTYTIPYSTQVYPFKEAVETMLGSKNLEKLHTIRSYDRLVREKDQSTHYHKAYYDQFATLLDPLYKKFVQDFIKPHFHLKDIIYQKIPTFRVQLVNNIAVGEYHKDRDYNHGITEINCWLPFTNAYDTNTIWLETEEDKGDYQPYKVNYGEVLIFDGANLMHGNKTNTTPTSRVSVDFRIVDPLRFIPNKNGSINMNTPFDIGGYFEKI